MPSDITKSDVAAALPSPSSSKCEAFKRLVNFPSILLGFVEYFFDDAGNLSDQFVTDICATGCAGGGGGTPNPSNPSMPAPTGVNATDGSFSDKIQVSWNAVVPPDGIDPVLEYKIYRALATETNPNSATLIATVAAPTLTYDDEDAVAGTTYNYWVKALNASETSAFSGSDVGSADAPSSDLDAVSDLRATVGWGDSRIRLVWTPPAGGTHYDVYRNTTNTFVGATKIEADIIPLATTTLVHPNAGANEFWENYGGELLLYHTPTSATQDYYFFVVAKKNSPPAESDESNSALGRVSAPAIYTGGSTTLDWATTTHVVGAYTKLRAIVFGSGGGGAGGSGTYGAGGGGGGAVVVETFTVAPGDTIDFAVTPSQENSDNAASTVNGGDGAEVEMQINTVAKINIPGGSGGEYSASGGGLGGAGGTGTGTTSPTIYNGHAGEPGIGSNGGRSGYIFGGRSVPMADGLGAFNGNSFVGAGAKAIPINPTLSVGGYGLSGSVLLQFGA